MANYIIEIEDHGFWWTARIPGTDKHDLVPSKCFYRLTAQKARQRAERWCILRDKQQRERYAVKQKAEEKLFTPVLDTD